MIELEPGKVIAASRHAVDQAQKRCPVLRGADRAGAIRWVESTAAKAIRDGRKSKRLPRWAVRAKVQATGYRSDMRNGRPSWFVWNLEETAVLVIQHTHRKAHEANTRVFLVTTVLTNVERDKTPTGPPEARTSDPVPS